MINLNLIVLLIAIFAVIIIFLAAKGKEIRENNRIDSHVEPKGGRVVKVENGLGEVE